MTNAKNSTLARTKLIAFMALVAALEVVFERFFTFDTAVTRLNFTFLPRALCGILFGPYYSAGVGIVADLIGTFIKGYTINIGITFAAALRGFTFGLLLYRSQSVPRIIIAAALDQFLAGFVVVSASLFILGGIPFAWPTMLTRFIQACILFACECVVNISLRKVLFVRIKKILE